MTISKSPQLCASALASAAPNVSSASSAAMMIETAGMAAVLSDTAEVGLALLGEGFDAFLRILRGHGALIGLHLATADEIEGFVDRFAVHLAQAFLQALDGQRRAG